jgi:hypothetical protein
VQPGEIPGRITDMFALHDLVQINLVFLCHHHIFDVFRSVRVASGVTHRV